MQIQKEGSKFFLYARYGRVGASGAITEKDFDTSEACIKEYIKMFKQKQKKGYVALKIVSSHCNS